MSFNFFPKIIKFFDLFEEQNAVLKEASTVLDSIFKDHTEVSGKCERINDLETKGDLLSRDISTQLALTFITPIDREDIHEINIAQEDLLNAIKAISSRVALYRFKKMEQGAVDLVDNLRILIEEIGIMLRKLSSKIEVEEHSKRVHAIRNESELHLLTVLGELYESVPVSQEGLLHVIKWTQIYDRIEQALDRADVLANAVEGISIKNA